MLLSVPVVGAALAGGLPENRGTWTPEAMASLLIGWAFGTAFAAHLGGTPGKLLLGLRIVDPATGTWPTGLRAVAREGVLTVSGLVPFGIGTIAVIAPAAFGDHEKRGVHDRLARTVVVRV